jgi:ketosteroid isomerase-like protein
MRRFAVTAYLALASFACASRTDVERQRAALMDADREFARATAARGVDGWVEAFADDGVQFRGSQRVVGHDSIRAHMGPAFADTTFHLEWEPVSSEAAASGDLGYTIGRWESWRAGPDGAPVTGSGSYVTIWRKDSAGVWKVAVDIGNPDQPPRP